MEKERGHIISRYIVSCHRCSNIATTEHLADYISSRFETDWVALIKKDGWKLTQKGWKCPKCSTQIRMNFEANQDTTQPLP